MSTITDSAALEALCSRLKAASYICVDTEFMRDTTYWPKLCLVQIAGLGEAVAVDNLAEGLDLAPLHALMADPSVLKVFHSARQDLEIFYNLMGQVPEPIFDTQVAAMVCGFGEAASYELLARKLAGARIDKSSRFADWSRRPLTGRQLDYALSDVLYLGEIHERLRHRLEKSGRAHWLSEEMDILTAAETYDLAPDKAWRRLKTRSNDRRFLGIAKTLAAWREREAQRRDVPRNRVLRDEQILDIAAHAPPDADALARTRGLGGDFARGRMGKAILDAVARGQAIPEDALPESKRQRQAPQGLGPLIDLLKVLLKLRCEENGVAQKLVANSADLELIAADDRADVRALSGWRRALFGADALALKQGRLALKASGRKIEVFPLSP